MLDRHDATFHQSVTLLAVVAAGGSVDRDELVATVTGYLKSGEATVRAVVEELIAVDRLVRNPAAPHRLGLTDAGRELYESTSAEAAEISARLYAGIPAEELAVAGRALTLVTERANAELADAA